MARSATPPHMVTWKKKIKKQKHKRSFSFLQTNKLSENVISFLFHNVMFFFLRSHVNHDSRSSVCLYLYNIYKAEIENSWKTNEMYTATRTNKNTFTGVRIFNKGNRYLSEKRTYKWKPSNIWYIKTKRKIFSFIRICSVLWKVENVIYLLPFRCQKDFLQRFLKFTYRHPSTHLTVRGDQ